MSATAGAHILLFPHPAQGHIIPLLDLAHQLSNRGLPITILITPQNVLLLHPLLSKCPTIQTLVLPFPKYASLPQGVENAQDLPPRYSHLAIIHAMGALYDPILHWFLAHPSPPQAILSDFLHGWTQKLATQLGIRRIVFYPSGAFLASVLDSLWANGHQVDPTSSNVTFPSIPKSPSFLYEHLPSVYRRCMQPEPGWEAAWEFVKDGMMENASSWGAIFNTYDAMEGPYLEHVRKASRHACVWGVGPLAVEGVGPTGRGGPSSARVEGVLTWLDGCPDRSVLYVCLGSEVMLTWHQVEALAAGLEESGARFIWCVKVSRHVAGDDKVEIPTGFAERVAERALIIRGWAPQLSILGHRSVGAFLTHCGWNSVLEGLTAGVPLIAWPMISDQFVNARLLVDELGVGVRICDGAHAVPDSKELARVVSDLFGATRPERLRATELSRAALDAVSGVGTSRGDLDDLVRELENQNKERGAI